MSNRYARSSHLSEEIFLFLLILFCGGGSINETFRKTKISTRTIGEYFRRFRSRLETELFVPDPLLSGTILVHSWCQSAGKHKYRATGGGIYPVDRPILLIMMDEKSNVFTIIIKNRNKNSLITEIVKNIQKGSTIITPLWKGYNGIENYGYIHITHSKSNDVVIKYVKLFEEMSKFINSIILKTREMSVVKSTTYFSIIKECEFRWNYKDKLLIEIFNYFVNSFKKLPLSPRPRLRSVE